MLLVLLACCYLKWLPQESQSVLPNDITGTEFIFSYEDYCEADQWLVTT